MRVPLKTEEVRELSIEVEGVEEAPRWKGEMLDGELEGFLPYAENAELMSPTGASPPPLAFF